MRLFAWLLVFCIFPVVFSKANTMLNTVVALKSHGIVWYEQPKIGAKVIERLTHRQQFTIIYQQGGWIEVVNPTNGQVGWINQADLLPKKRPRQSLIRHT